MSELFAHLHGHSHFSNLTVPDAIGTPTDLVARAKDIGLTSIALTDHGTVAGIPELVKAAAKAGIKPIVGSELYCCIDASVKPAKGEAKPPTAHVVALAKNWDGFIELCQMLSKAGRPEHFYYRPRTSFDDLANSKHLLFTTACQGGILCHPEHEQVMNKLAGELGKERLFVEIQPIFDDGQKATNRLAIATAERLGLDLVAAQDYHYPAPEMANTHEVLLTLRQLHDGITWTSPNRQYYYPRGELYVRSPREMAAAFFRHVQAGELTAQQVATALRNSVKVTELTDFKWQKMPITLPVMSDNPAKTLLTICMAELKRRGLDTKPEYAARLKFEFETMLKSGFISYFLILRDIVQWARSNDVMVGPGRGSAAGSLISYLAGVTGIDPIQHGLIFERFYRPGRIDLPDIDIDFDQERRDEVLEYIRQRFGKENVAGIGNYNRLKGKSAINDAARIFSIPMDVVRAATAHVEEGKDLDIDPKLDAEQNVFSVPEVKALFARFPTLDANARGLVGVLRTFGQHAAGVVISGEPIANRAQLMHRDEREVVCWDKRIVEEFGLMKLDVLGLRTMTILRKTRENIYRLTGRRLDYDAIPLDDALTLGMFNRADTTGIFQYESDFVRAVLKQINVNEFQVIADVTALARPGPMDMISEYVAVQTGAQVAHFDHPLLEPILKPTNGVLIYQEQLMRIWVELAGVTFAEADGIRKIVGKKLGEDEFRKYEGKFVEGCVTKGIDEQTAKRIFAKQISFAQYGFNLSHTVSYALIAYWTGYVKMHYPAAFFAAHLTCTDDGDKVALAVDEVRRLGFDVVMPCVNRSEAINFIPIDEKTIVAPLSAIKGVGEKASNAIVQARAGIMDSRGLKLGETRQEKGGLVSFDPTTTRAGDFISDQDFLGRVYKRVVNSGVQTKLSEVGAFPWCQPIQEVLRENRRKHLGAIAIEKVRVDATQTIDFSLDLRADLGRLLFDIGEYCSRRILEQMIPAFTAASRLMIVWEKPNQRGVGRGPDQAIISELLGRDLGMSISDFYMTSFYRFAKVPMSWETFDQDMTEFLNREVKIVKPPVILALGARPVKHFTGMKPGESHGKVTMFGDIPVVTGKSPWLYFRDMNKMNGARLDELSPQMLEDLRAISIALASIYK